MVAVSPPNAPIPLVLSLSKDTRPDQPLCVGFDRLSLSELVDMAERSFSIGGAL